jgi:DNA-binding MarR family transcriptional regulator
VTIHDDAAAFAELFPAIYLRFHRRDGKESALPAASHAVMHHLSLTGPLTVGEMAQHLERAQSVVSEIVDHLEEKKLLERMRDPRDKRRTLVWLTDDGLARLSREREVLERELLEASMKHMTAAERTALINGMRALVRANEKEKP